MREVEKIVARLRERPVLALGLLAALLFLAGAGALLWLNTPRHRISRESFEKIQVGMTRAEVEEILGVPPGDYGPGNTYALLNQSRGATFPTGWSTVAWKAGDMSVLVAYDLEGRVAWKKLGRALRRNFLSRLRRWLGWNPFVREASSPQGNTPWRTPPLPAQPR